MTSSNYNHSDSIPQSDRPQSPFSVPAQANLLRPVVSESSQPIYSSKSPTLSSHATYLDIRTKDYPVQNTPERPPRQATLNLKRNAYNIIDLTNDDGYESSDRSLSYPRKRSRSSSDSSSKSLEKDKSSSVIANPARRPSALQRTSSDFAEIKEVKVTGNVRPKPESTPQQNENRQKFFANLSVLKGVTLINDIDNEVPDTDFQFINQSVLGPDVHRITEEVMLGCTCQKRYKQQYGCVYLDWCTCIQDQAPDDQGKRAFSYGASEKNYRCLRPKVLKSRMHIYECNSHCDCTQNCKNRVVQHGRQVKLEIFKTVNRGWGLRCKEDLKQGQFIDTYRGEIITSDESDRRAKKIQPGQPNYLFDLDKFETDEYFDETRHYVCDGTYMGSPTRFINHSCEPNCGMYTVSYNHNDRNIYELAFFAREAIPRGTELTFDYLDDEDTITMTDEMADEVERAKGYRPTRCFCGSKDCRRYFFD